MTDFPNQDAAAQRLIEAAVSVRDRVNQTAAGVRDLSGPITDVNAFAVWVYETLSPHVRRAEQPAADDASEIASLPESLANTRAETENLLRAAMSIIEHIRRAATNAPDHQPLPDDVGEFVEWVDSVLRGPLSKLEILHDWGGAYNLKRLQASLLFRVNLEGPLGDQERSDEEQDVLLHVARTIRQSPVSKEEASSLSARLGSALRNRREVNGMLPDECPYVQRQREQEALDTLDTLIFQKSQAT